MLAVDIDGDVRAYPVQILMWRRPPAFVVRAVVILALVALAAGVIRRRRSGPNPSEQPAHTGTTHDDQTPTSAVGLRAPTQP